MYLEDVSGSLRPGDRRLDLRSADGGRSVSRLDPASCLLGLTMKFGKDLEQYKHPEWEDEYMNYQMLKDILRKLESQAKVRLDCDCPT